MWPGPYHTHATSVLDNWYLSLFGFSLTYWEHFSVKPCFCSPPLTWLKEQNTWARVAHLHVCGVCWRWRSLTPFPVWISGTPLFCCASKRPSRATKAIWSNEKSRGGGSGMKGTRHHACFYTHTHMQSLLHELHTDLNLHWSVCWERKSSGPHLWSGGCCRFLCCGLN